MIDDYGELEAWMVGRLRELYTYDPATGEIRTLQTRSRWPAGRIAGFIHRDGRRYCKADGVTLSATHIAHALMTGHLPSPGVDVDHKDGVRDNDRWDNLRLASRAQNSWNRRRRRDNTSGFKGVSLDRSPGRRRCWRAEIVVEDKHIGLGRFHTPEQASAAYEAAARELHGEYYRKD